MRRLMMPSSTIKHFRRFQQVVNVLAKYGFGEVLSRIRIWQHVNIERKLFRREHELATLTTPQRLRLALEELGPTFIKLGQMLSTRPDLVPPEIIVELKKLQASVHFVPIDTIKSIIETELGKPISELFESFDETPLAAASLAQVHRAVFQGNQVVLKVQRPDIVEITEMDVDIMRRVARLAERYSPMVYLINPVGLVEEFAQQINRELDFRMEANNIRRFAQNFANDDTIHIPEVFPEVCTRCVLTMEYLDGINISETQRLIDEGYDLQLIARRGAILAFKATFQHGFFHADPHPGNIFVLPGNIIGLVDFGMMAILSLRDRERLAKLVYFISVSDEKRVARALNELMESEEIIPAEELEPSMSAIVKEYGDIPIRELRLAGMLFAMMQSVITHGARLRPQLIWVTKSIATQEEIARSLGADFNLADLGKPYAQKVLTQKLNPMRQPRELYYWFIDASDMVRDLPYDIGIVLREFRKGRLKIEFEHVGLEPIRRTMDRVANRTSLTIIIAALLVSSSVIVLAKVPPFVGNIPLLGFIGYIIAVILGSMLVISIVRR
ncbi:MAG: AarF/ABC1/UbiB kinase family protein [Chloroflexi bacterium]|nr:AarF/ABC1/UbiB kinase family protein [Chloroflexota bacterium]